MRQVCNLSYVSQARLLDDDDEVEKWDRALHLEPGKKLEWSPRPQHIDPGLDSLMAPGGRR